jgi:hypothetical protein
MQTSKAVHFYPVITKFLQKSVLVITSIGTSKQDSLIKCMDEVLDLFFQGTKTTNEGSEAVAHSVREPSESLPLSNAAETLGMARRSCIWVLQKGATGN